MKHRLYIDEVGNSDMGASQDPNHRYLSLTGVILELGYVDVMLHPQLEGMKKRFFGSHADEPVVLHRKELIQKKPPFEALRDPAVEKEFAADLIKLLENAEYAVITTVIDKLEHHQKYAKWRYDPYHYCLHVILERYVMWMRRRGFKGDVMAESRGKKEDMRLKKSFGGIWERGTDLMDSKQFQENLTSKELKVKPKANNIAGLQLADVLAYPAWKAALAKTGGNALPENLTGRIGTLLLDTKFDRGPSGTVTGWGLKYLP
jgi:hypothetical protein